MYLITNTLLYTYIQISYLQGRVEEEGGEGIRNGKRESGVERREVEWRGGKGGVVGTLAL